MATILAQRLRLVYHLSFSLEIIATMGGFCKHPANVFLIRRTSTLKSHCEAKSYHSRQFQCEISSENSRFML